MERIDTLRQTIRDILPRSYVPYSGRPEATLILLSDGHFIPGVRVENASFSLTLPSLQNAVTTAVALGRADVTAIVHSRPFSASELEYVSRLAYLPDLRHEAEDLLLAGSIIAPSQALTPFLSNSAAWKPEERLRLARGVASAAHVPESGFRVGVVVALEDGRCIPGVNVEHPDWTNVLCAERNAIGTGVSYGFRALDALYLTAPDDRAITPCGACRQVLAELAPETTLWMDRVNEPEATTPLALLPARFTATHIQAREGQSRS